VTQKIGSYDVLDLIGDGGMGAVYRGRDPRFDRLVAIKVLHSHFLRDPGVVERFKAEAVIQAKLSHPHIVTVFDFVAQADTLAIVMDLVDGLPLDELIERGKGPMAMDRAVRLMDQILSAMGYAHQRGLVHRDIKPSNILVLSVEGQEFAKVMDFGIAKILGSEKLQTATGAKMGTLAYMSPEHVRSPKHVDVRSDVYSLGVVLYEMLTGQVPFDADSEYELMRQIVQDDPRDIGQLPSRVGPALGGVVRKALAKDPAARFQSCTEMRQALGDRDERESLDRVAPASALPASASVGPAHGHGAGARTSSPGTADTATAAAPARSTLGLLVGLAVLVLAVVVGVLKYRAAESERRIQAEAQASLQRERERAQQERERLEAEKREAIAAERARQARALQEARRQAEEAAAAVLPSPTFRVIKVAANDILNLRDRPHPSGQVVGRIPPNGRGVIWLGDKARVGRFDWYRVRYQGSEGWANSAFLEPE
jgi:hypothetical protein